MVLGCMGCSNEWKSKDNVALTVIINAHYLRACGLFFRSNTMEIQSIILIKIDT